MNILVHPTYFPNIASFSAIAQNEVTWEVSGNFQKQTNRNRCYIATDRGKQMLNLPVKHVGTKGKQPYKEVMLDNNYKWQRQHWRTLETAYRTSPFFEFYEDELAPLFHTEQKYLLDFNLKTIETVFGCLQTDIQTKTTTEFIKEPEDIVDIRFLANAKNSLDFKQQEYTHVFSDRHPFIENLSILDLLFNEGTNAFSYLNQQNLGFLNA